jgi:AAA+ ATPase superfamily predicted ATPase
MSSVSDPGEVRQVGGYLKILSERYRMIERRLPIFSPPKARSGRYYIRDNFLRAWLSALQRPVSAIAFRPLEMLISQADERLADVEGHALEDLAGQVYEERSRSGIGDFALTERIRGYWDRGDVEIDLVAVGEEHRRLRFGTCKRSAERLPASVEALRQNAQRFLAAHRRFEGWRIDFAAIAPDISGETRRVLERLDVIPQSLSDLTREL